MLGTLMTNLSLQRVPEHAAESVFQNPVKAGEELSRFLENGARMSPPPFININREATDTKQFFHNSGWTIWKGSISGDGLEGEDLQDSKSLNVSILDANRLIVWPSKSMSETCSERVATTWDGMRLVRPDWSVFVTLSRNRHLIDRFFADERFRYLVFGGAIVRDPKGQPRMPILPKSGQVEMLHVRADELSAEHPSLLYFY